MVRSVTFEIRWHDTQPIYSCSFQPLAPSHLRRVLDHNAGQAAGLPPGKTLASAGAAAAGAGQPGSSHNSAQAHAGAEGEDVPKGTSSGTSTNVRAPPILAGGQSWRLATAGGDNNVRIWMVHPNIPSPAALASAAAASGSASLPAPHPPRVEFLATLSRHTGVVNAVRFCPKGELLATAGDDGNVLFWIPSERGRSAFGEAHGIADEGEGHFEKEFWRVRLMTRATQQELYDLAWAPNGETLAAGGTDFVARIINAQDGNVIREISEHSHYVQGIAWDPLNDFIATQSSDRSVHVHSLHSKAFGDSSHSSGIGTISTVSRNSRMDLHRRTGSGSFVWDHNAKPPMQRRGSSHASHASDSGQERERETPSQGGRPRTGRSITPFDPQGSSHSALSTQDTPTASGSGSGSGAAQQPPTPTALHHSARAVTPTPGPSVPQSPFSSASASASAHAMNPPQTTPSRRSSFSGSNADCASPPANHSTLSAHSFSAHHGPTRTSSRTRTGRSPSPVPPLPAIRALPSPKHRARAQTPGAAGTGQSQGQGQALTKSSLRLYGDENFSGFFRRLTFSPDGALLVTPGGVFDAPPLPASPTVSVRAVRNASEPSTDPGTPSCSTPTPTSKSVSSLAPYQAHSASAAASSNTGPRSTVYIYARGNLHRSDAPVAHLPGHKTASIVVKFSPILYELRPGSSGAGGSSAGSGAGSTLAPHPTVPLEVGKQKSVTLYQAGTSVANASANASAGASANPASSSALDDSDDPELPPAGSAGAWAGASARRSAAGTSVFGLPYRMVYAVATQDSVWIYDTQQSGPLCCFSNMHYASFTDLAWSPDGQTLMMSSSDGYCSVVVFDYAELGHPYNYSVQPSLQALSSNSAAPPAPAHHAHGTSSPALGNKASGAAVSHPASNQAPASSPAAARTESLTSSGSAAQSAPAPALGLGLSTGTGTATGPDHASTSAYASGLAMMTPPPTPSPAPALAAASSSAANEHVGTTTGASAEPKKKKRRIAPTLESGLGS